MSDARNFLCFGAQEHELTPARAPQFGKHRFLFAVINLYEGSPDSVTKGT